MNSVDQFVDLITKADTAGYIMAVAILCNSVGQDGADIVKGYTRADFKRAIKGLRVHQRQEPQYAERYEEAIGHIRRFWLHGGAFEQGAAL